MSSPSNSVFISYRRTVAGIYALAVYQHLDAHRIDAFYDIESIKAGQFGEIILGQIAAHPYFMPIFTSGTLTRCVDPGDWVRREIEHALSLNRMLVPLHTPEFDFEDLQRYLPHVAGQIKAFNMVELPTNQLKYFKYAMQDVVENYLKPISITLAAVSPPVAYQVARVKETLDAQPAVTEKQLTVADYLERGSERQMKGDYEGAIIDFTEAIRLQPSYVDTYIQRGLVRTDIGDHEGAIKDFSEAIRLQPDYAPAYMGRGLARIDMNDYYGAIDDFGEAIRFEPNDANAYQCRGNARADKGDYSAALADFDVAIRLNPNDSAGFYYRGYVRLQVGDKQGTVEDYQRALELNPKHQDAAMMHQYIKDHSES